ncbi:MAG: SRPBCC family protein [Verrucomicrobiota bacterium]
MLSTILIGLAVLVVLLLIIAALQPAQFVVERNGTVSAPPAAVFPYVNDFQKWGAWSPWEKLDPNLKRTFSGPAAGVGAVYEWAGNKQAGEGRMTITESRPSDLVRIKLEFLKPFTATNTTIFTFTPIGEQTAVNWRMTGEKNFLFKLVGLFMSMDKMVGKDFEKGLMQLRAAAEAGVR